jgi:uncharacterized membrane protein
VCAERVQGRARGRGRRTLGEPGGVALARGRHGRGLARSDCATNIAIVGAADTHTGAIAVIMVLVTVMVVVVVVIVIVVIALLCARVGGGGRVIRGRG